MDGFIIVSSANPAVKKPRSPKSCSKNCRRLSKWREGVRWRLVPWAWAILDDHPALGGPGSRRLCPGAAKVPGTVTFRHGSIKGRILDTPRRITRLRDTASVGRSRKWKGWL